MRIDGPPFKHDNRVGARTAQRAVGHDFVYARDAIPETTNQVYSLNV